MNYRKRLPVVLFFTDGPFMTTADEDNARSLAATVLFRNAKLDAGPMEDCEAVAGHAPDRYRAACEYVGTDPREAAPAPVGTPPAADSAKPAPTTPPAAPAPAPGAGGGWKANA